MNLNKWRFSREKQKPFHGDFPQKVVNLVGGLEHEFYDFPYLGNVIIPTDELIFFRGVGQPPTRNGFLIGQMK